MLPPALRRPAARTRSATSACARRFPKAIDRDAIVARIMGGVAMPAGELLPPMMFGANKDMKAPKADVDAAKKLLAEAGYPNGFTLVLARQTTVTSTTRRSPRRWRRC